jgi:hypothetical protein
MLISPAPQRNIKWQFHCNVRVQSASDVFQMLNTDAATARAKTCLLDLGTALYFISTYTFISKLLSFLMTLLRMQICC